jgi:hypothetical protein
MAGEIKADQGSSIDGENDPASAVEVEEAVATTAIYGDDGEGAPATGVWGGMVKKRLPDAEVQSILCRERREFAPNTSNMSEEEVEIMRRAVQAFNALSDDFAEYQAEARAECEAKGYVEVDDDFVKYSEEERQWIREQLADMFDGLDFSDVQEEEEEYDYNNECEEKLRVSPESKSDFPSACIRPLSFIEQWLACW